MSRSGEDGAGLRHVRAQDKAEPLFSQLWGTS